MPFDWQAELATAGGITHVAPAAMATQPHKPASRISFAQALRTSPTISSNDNLPQPLIKGESVSIKISQDMYEKGMAVCKRNLRVDWY